MLTSSSRMQGQVFSLFRLANKNESVQAFSGRNLTTHSNQFIKDVLVRKQSFSGGSSVTRVASPAWDRSTVNSQPFGSLDLSFSSRASSSVDMRCRITPWSVLCARFESTSSSNSSVHNSPIRFEFNTTTRIAESKTKNEGNVDMGSDNRTSSNSTSNLTEKRQGMSSNNEIGDDEKIATKVMKMSYKELLQKYGSTAFVFHTVVWVGTLGAVWAGVAHGPYDPNELVKMIPYVDESILPEGAGSFALAYSLTALTGPARIALDVACTPWIASKIDIDQYLPRTGIAADMLRLLGLPPPHPPFDKSPAEEEQVKKS